jgi:transketolase
MRNRFAHAFYEAAQTNPKLALVVADISPASSIQLFRENYPDRFINVGVAEQTMIGICAGMALRGYQTFAYTIATFSLYRPFEMIRDDLCYQNLPVTVVGIGGGVTYSTLGGTHHAQEDIAIAGALPNMQIIAPCDPEETAAATAWCAIQRNGPVYLRLGKAGEPDLTAGADEPFTFGKIRKLRGGQNTAVLSYGPIMGQAFEVAKSLGASLYSVHTLKPLDHERLTSILQSYRRIVIVEEMAPTGGLTQATKALAYDIGSSAKIIAFTLQDAFIHQYGSHSDLLAAHGISVNAMLTKLADLK